MGGWLENGGKHCALASWFSIRRVLSSALTIHTGRLERTVSSLALRGIRRVSFLHGSGSFLLWAAGAAETVTVVYRLCTPHAELEHDMTICDGL